jgi:hypothetical protein
MRNLSVPHRLSLACITLLALGSLACGDDKKDEAGEADGSGTAESGESADAPETSGSSMEGDGDGDPGDGDPGDGDPGDGDPGDGDPGDGDPGDGDPGDGDPGDGDPGDGDGDQNSPCFDHETQDDCESDAACQAVVGQPLQENGPDAPCLDPAEFIGCIAMTGCDDALTWFCVGGGGKAYLVNNGCGPDGAEMCDPEVQDPPECQ